MSTDTNEATRKVFQKSWTEMGQLYPWYSVLTSCEKSLDIDEEAKRQFYDSGREDVTLVLQRIMKETNSVMQYSGTKALDFGCGLGRLTFGLSHFFSTVMGCDHSAAHLAIAEEQAVVRMQGAWGKVTFHHNEATTDDLSILVGTDFDFILSLLTLQHIPPSMMVHYISQFCTLLKPGGQCYFQVPVFIPGYKTDITINSGNIMQMHAIELGVILDILHRAACKLVNIHIDDKIGIPDSLSLAIHFIKPNK